MRKAFFLLIVSVLFTGLYISSARVGYGYPSGSPAAYTGSPGDGQHCQSCHGGNVATVNNWITTNIPAEGYTPGSVYTITVTVSGTGKKGFEVSPQNAAGAQLGVLAAGTGSHLVGGTKYVTQNSSGSTSGTVTWNFSWTAPVAGTGQVTFYGAFTVGEPNTKLSATVVNEYVAMPLGATATANPDLVCIGTSVQLNVTATGGSGNYTYNWSSNPPGFTSTLQNPWVTPQMSTQYIAHVSDGPSVVDAPVSVTVTLPCTAIAGNDTTCLNTVTQVPVNGISSNFSSVLWETSGTGTFTAPASLGGYYIPSPADIVSGQVELSLTAQPIPPCVNPAGDSRLVMFSDPAGLYEENGLSVSVCPNPVTDRFNVTISKAGSSGELQVVNPQGMVVFSGKFSGNVSSMVVETGFQPAGLYLVVLKTEEGTVRRKIIIR